MRIRMPEDVRDRIRRVANDGNAWYIRQAEEKPPSLWDAVKMYCNSQRGEDRFSRQDLLEYLKELGHYDTAVAKAERGASTIDTYRNYLTQAGYLYKVGHGWYNTVRDIEEFLTLPEVKEQAYSPGINEARRRQEERQSELMRSLRSLDDWMDNRRDRPTRREIDRINRLRGVINDTTNDVWSTQDNYQDMVNKLNKLKKPKRKKTNDFILEDEFKV